MTYANASTVTSKGTRKKLEETQRNAGRWALGQPTSKLANEFIEGELGWSTFEAREAQAKMLYLARLKEMPDERWPKAILNMIDMCKLKTTFVKRERELYSRFEFDRELTDNMSDNIPFQTFQKNVKSHIKKVSDEIWKDGMQEKNSLSRYNEFKKSRGDMEHIYDNSRASARAGFLRTRTFRFENIDVTCQRCKKSQETLEHVIMECGNTEMTWMTQVILRTR